MVNNNEVQTVLVNIYFRQVFPQISTHFRLNKLPHYMWKESNFNCRYVRLCYLDIPGEKNVKLLANCGFSDQTLCGLQTEIG